jgi:PAS domain S-box-containing protein
LEANRAALNAYGYSREELLKLTIRDLRSPETTEAIGRQMSAADSQGILFETIHRTKNGRDFPVEVSSQGADIQGIRALISIIRDISDRKSTAQQLLDLDSAVRVILEKSEESKREWQQNVLLRIKVMVLPFLEQLCSSRLNELQKSCLAAIEDNLKEIVAPFNGFASVNFYNFTEKELQIADLIKRGKATKEIAELLQISKRAVEFHRNNLRRKLGISNQKANLKNHLCSLK